MAIKLRELLEACESWLRPEQFDDFAPNGLQVQGREEVALVVAGVTACQALLDRAVELGAGAVLVHHGYFWRGEDPCLTGIKYRRIKTLIDNDISLIAYHLPLDAHPELGNNVQLAGLLGIEVVGGVPATGSPAIALMGRFSVPLTGVELRDRIERVLIREPLHIAADRPIKSVAWCTGGGQGYIEQAVAAGVDAFISGEASEQTVHLAREHGIHFYAAGHHATERYGVQALGERIARELAVDVVFVDIDNPV
ncbi:dinuclear metal center YbgI/SA1388 family protein [Sinobacterium caligoides]|uniref:GTP cyclohydrolase 1 type 2 homolog n=1 Tax=Sinobacterium caligoides TaxID=933926 RepID=A0A3N2E1W0_9GAMM|nr:Nif3-like dinuclear metal center hexameric protein [Sinobacterium caligoides]ROS06103.1 dinuclear metal center YbgI/SA1388 family protein [Sinobacterium caligoides]